MTRVRWTLTLTADDVHLEAGPDTQHGAPALERLSDELATAAQDVNARAVASAGRRKGPAVIDAARLRSGSPTDCLAQVLLREGHDRPQVTYGHGAHGMEAHRLLLALGSSLTQAAVKVTRPVAA